MLGIGPWVRMSRLVPESHALLLARQIDMAVLALATAEQGAETPDDALPFALIEVGGDEAPPTQFRRYLGGLGLVWDAYNKVWTGIVTADEADAIRIQAELLAKRSGWKGEARVVAPLDYRVRFERVGGDDAA